MPLCAVVEKSLAVFIFWLLVLLHFCLHCFLCLLLIVSFFRLPRVLHSFISGFWASKRAFLSSSREYLGLQTIGLDAKYKTRASCICISASPIHTSSVFHSSSSALSLVTRAKKNTNPLCISYARPGDLHEMHTYMFSKLHPFSSLSPHVPLDGNYLPVYIK